MDPLRTPDATIYLYCLVEGIAEAWVPRGTTSGPMGGTYETIIANRNLSAMLPRIEPWKGIGSSGHLSLDLVDQGGYLSRLMAAGTETTLAATMDPGDGTIETDDASGLDSSGTVHIHRCAYTYSGKSGDDLTGVVRTNDHLDEYEPTHRVDLGTSFEQDGYVSPVRVGTTPAYLEGRYISIHAIALDVGGYPITDDDGESDFEIWRGIITAAPPSPDGAGYKLQCETLERLIQQDPPVSGIAGKLMTGAWDTSLAADGDNVWGMHTTPIFISYKRRRAHLGIVCTSADNPLDLVISVDLLDGASNGQWMTSLQIQTRLAVLIRSAFPSQGANGIDVILYFYDPPISDGDPDPSTQFRMMVTLRNYAYLDGAIAIWIYHGAPDVWRQLGFLGVLSDSTSITAGSDATLALFAPELPATLYIKPTDTEIPVITNAQVIPSQGWGEMGDEVFFYGGTDVTQLVDNKLCVILTDCSRGFAGTTAQQHIYRMGDPGASRMPEIQPVYCIGGNDTMGANEADASIWVSLLKVLTGTNDEATNGDYEAFPGLGISIEHIDVAAIDSLKTLPPYAGSMYGTLSSLRSFLSDALALEGYALVTRPIADGTCRLTPVRMGASSTSETALDLDIDAAAGVTIRGGLGEVINRVDITGPSSEAMYHDAESIATFGVRQKLAYKLPVPDEAGVIYLAAAVRRIFAIAGGRAYFLGEFSVDPSGRMVAPGDILALTFPNSALTGNWRVLSATTPVRGRGSVRVRAMRISAWSCSLCAPTTEIDSINGSDIVLTVEDSSWYQVGGDVWIYDPDEYSDGYVKRITAIPDDETLTLSNTTDLTVGDYVEYEKETTNTDDRYVWLVIPPEQEWGD